jgi:glycosyltransferase involved in cell wall biosynthesis
MKRVLIITYYWPPSGGAGVQRWLKFSKYLRNFGWEPVIYTPENPEAPAQDFSLVEEIPKGIEVIKTRIWEPYSAYKRFVGRSKDDRIKAGFLSERQQPSITEKISVWIRGNMFIPDARKFWIRPSVKFLIRYLKENPVDAIVSTGPPHSMHRIALEIKRKLNIPWLSDFRDPWTNIDFYDDLMLTGFAHRKHKRQEREVLNAADKVVTVSCNWAKDCEKFCSRSVDVVTNGYDPEDFKDLAESETNEKFILCHIGSLNKDRNPEFLWQCIGQIAKEDNQFKRDLMIRFIGQVDYKAFDDLAKFDLIENTEMIDYLPHNQTLLKASESSVLLLLLNNTPNVNGIVPGKVFEYLALKRPVLCIGIDTGDTARIIRETQAGFMINFGDTENCLKMIRELYQKFRNNDLKVFSEKIEKFSRVEKTREIAKLLDETISGKL